MKHYLLSLGLVVMLMACTTSPEVKNISQSAQQEAINAIQAQAPSCDADLLQRGVTQAASLWQPSDGTEEEFIR